MWINLNSTLLRNAKSTYKKYWKLLKYLQRYWEMPRRGTRVYTTLTFLKIFLIHLSLQNPSHYNIVVHPNIFPFSGVSYFPVLQVISNPCELLCFSPLPYPIPDLLFFCSIIYSFCFPTQIIKPVLDSFISAHRQPHTFAPITMKTNPLAYWPSPSYFTYYNQKNAIMQCKKNMFHCMPSLTVTSFSSLYLLTLSLSLFPKLWGKDFI